MAALKWLTVALIPGDNIVGLRVYKVIVDCPSSPNSFAYSSSQPEMDSLESTKRLIELDLPSRYIGCSVASVIPEKIQTRKEFTFADLIKRILSLFAG